MMKLPGKKEIQIGKSTPAWMLTYSDLITQILIFFVLMFALASAMNEMQIIKIRKMLEAFIAQEKLEHSVLIDVNEKGLVVSLKEQCMFDSGDALIYEDAKGLLTKISNLLIDYPNHISVEGHTDNVPISGRLRQKYPTNWELSTARATNVTRYLIEETHFPPLRLTSSGYGEYHPLFPNDSTERRAANRRVDIVVNRLSNKMKPRTRQ